MSNVIQKYEEFTPELATNIIGHLYPEPIVKTRVSSLGEGVGLMSSIARAHLTMSSGQEASVVIKCVARNHNSELAKGINFYRNEVNFYNHLADQAPIAYPKALFAEVEPDTQDFLLVLEDLGTETAGDQLVGCSGEQLLIAFERAAQLHGTFWERTSEFDWLFYQVDMKTIIFRRDAILKPGVQPTIDYFPAYFTGERANILRKIAEQFAELFLKGLGGPQTVIHGDYRTDNMFLIDRDGDPDIIAFDWQNTTGGNGTHDIAYFCSQSANPEFHGDSQINALRRYYETLIDQGVKGFSFDECLERYRYNLLLVMITPVAICGTLDQGNERGVKLGETILERSFSAMESMNASDLLK